MTTRILSEALTGTSVSLPEGVPLLEAEGIELRFGGTRAIDGVSFDVRAGELFAVIGPNGAGKTSIFNCISGVYRPQAGSIRFLGDELIGERPDRIAKRGVARTFQNIELFDNLTVVENLMLGRHQHLDYGVLEGMLYLGRARRAELANRRVVEDIIDFLEIAAQRKLPVGMLPVRREEAGRARPCARDGAEAPAARRAGRRHERRGDRGHGPVHPRHPLGARHVR
jgi:branched-chain amino acid transport system ATP-binding protein